MRFFKYVIKHYSSELSEEWPAIFACFITQTAFCFIAFLFFRFFYSNRFYLEANDSEKEAFYVYLYIFLGLASIFLLAAYLFEHHLTRKRLPIWFVSAKLGLDNRTLIGTFFIGLLTIGLLSFLAAYGIDGLLCYVKDAPMPEETMLIGAYPTSKTIFSVLLCSLGFSFISFLAKVGRYLFLRWRSSR
ncbi:MAG: hypothetical protein J6328_05030 [Bacilli bacterium]|nr:hypothetical protein [Bacilli bacterium]